MSALTPLEQGALNEFKTNLEHLLGDRVTTLYLYGSRARSEGNEESDIDILVLVAQRSAAERNTIIDAAHDISLKYEISLSPLVLSESQFDTLVDHERLLAREIMRDRIRL